MNVSSFIDESKDHLSLVLDESGSVLYSSINTLAPGMFYILGLNPGGSSGSKIRHRLDALNQHTENAYLDENWSSNKRSYRTGGHPLQRHLSMLMEQLGQNLRNVCASNLIFTRSSDQSGANFPQNGDICWPVHRLILSIVQPSIIIAFGNGTVSPYAFIHKKHYKTHGVWPRETECEAEHGSWKCKVFKTRIDDFDILVLGLPHLSRYTIEGRSTVMNWIRSKIREHNNSIQRAIK